MAYSTNLLINSTLTSGLVSEDYSTLASLGFASDQRADGFGVVDGSMATINGTAGNDTLTGTSERDNIYGLGGDDTINGLGGNDGLYGGEGIDTINGGDGDDIIFGGQGANILNGDGGDDLFLIEYADGGSINGGSGNDSIEISLNRFDHFVGVTLDFSDLWTGGSGSIGSMNITNVEGFSGVTRTTDFDDLITIGSTYTGLTQIDSREGNDIIYGGSGSDSVGGGEGNDTIYGELGDDTLGGGLGSDTIYGGLGDDDIAGNLFTTTSGDFTTNYLYGEEGNDSILGGDGNDIIDGGEDNDVLLGAAGDDNIIGGAGNDSITTGHGNDTVSGGAGNDLIFSEAGTNNVDGGAGDDNLVISTDYGLPFGGNVEGGDGYDTLHVDLRQAGGPVNIDLTGLWAGGTGMVGAVSVNSIESITSGGAIEVSNFDDIVIIGSAYTQNASVSGNGGDDFIRGGQGDDSLNGGFGTDTIYGGLGDDIISERTDTSGNFLYGEEGNDTIYGGNGIDFIEGGNGNDTVLGEAGNDVIHGGNDDDTLSGNDGDDEIYGDAGNDRIFAGADNDTMHGGEGNDTIFAGSGDDTLRGGAGNDTLYGEDGIDNLFGGAGNDLLDGGAGNDRMRGNDGDDIYLVEQSGDRVIEGVGEGLDTVNASVSFSLGANIENLQLIGASLDGRGNSAGNVITSGGGEARLFGRGGADTLNGSSGNDRLLGQGDDDILFGNGGDDILAGGDGDDIMNGGHGNDIYYVQNLGDVVTESGGGGIDTVRARVDYVMDDGIEILSMSAAARIGTGNALDNTIFGRGGGDTLSGLAGNDIIRGGNAADIIDGGTGDDLIDGGQGKDIMTGGDGVDKFQFRFANDFNTTLNTADVITDFDQGLNERIQLNAIDANINTGANDAFEWISTNAFSNTAGEMRYQQIAGDTFIEGDTDGDGQADMMVRLTGLYTLDATDIIGASDLQANSAPASPSLLSNYSELFADSGLLSANVAGVGGVAADEPGNLLSGAMSALADTTTSRLSAVSLTANSDDEMIGDAFSPEGPAGFEVAPAAAFEGEGGSSRMDAGALFDAPMPELISLYVDNAF